MAEERRMFPELFGDLSKLPVSFLQEPLVEIASGTTCFGPMEEWTDWYHYLLPRLIPRSHEAFVNYLLENLVTAFMALYPEGIVAPPYPGFRDDSINTLGRCMMRSELWRENEIVVGTCLHQSNNNPAKVWGWWDASGDFSASMFFCLKYLEPYKIGAWLRSVLDIASPHWRAQIMVWLLGAHDLLTARIAWPGNIKEGTSPSVEWNWSHTLKPDSTVENSDKSRFDSAFLPLDSRLEALDTVHGYFDAKIFRDWNESVSQVPYLSDELGDLPARFHSLYVRSE